MPGPMVVEMVIPRTNDPGRRKAAPSLRRQPWCQVSTQLIFLEANLANRNVNQSGTVQPELHSTILASE